MKKTKQADKGGVNLNHPKLQYNRKEVLTGLVTTLNNKTWKKSEIIKARDHYAAKQNGKYEPYCGILIWYLNKKLRTLT